MPKRAGDGTSLALPRSPRLFHFAHIPKVNELEAFQNGDAQASRRGRPNQDPAYLFRIVVKIEQRQRQGCADICIGRVRHSAAPGSQRPAPAGSQPLAGAALIAARRPITSPLRSPEINEAASRRDVVSRSRSNVVNLDRMTPALGLGGWSAPGPRLETSPLRTATFGFKPITFAAAALFSFAHFQL